MVTTPARHAEETHHACLGGNTCTPPSGRCTTVFFVSPVVDEVRQMGIAIAVWGVRAREQRGDYGDCEAVQHDGEAGWDEM